MGLVRTFNGLEFCCRLGWRAGLLVAGLVLTGWPLWAEGRGILELDPGSGAATLRVPLGPGIGRPGLRFVPALVGKFAPRVERMPEGEAGAAWRVAATGFDLSPGTLELRRAGEADLVAGRWTCPDGSGGRTQEGTACSLRSRCPTPSPFMLAGLGGEILSAQPEASDADGFPLRVGVVRGEVTYSFHRTAGGAGTATYRLEAIHGPSGEAITFTYGANGMDFEAAWGSAKVRVELPGTSVPALDPGACQEMRALLTVTYAGLEAPSGWAVTVRGRPDDLVTAVQAGAGPSSLLQALQVARVEGGDSREEIEFRYGEAPTATEAGPGGAGLIPPVLREIVLPGRVLELEWERQPCPRLADGDGELPAASWDFGVGVLRERETDGGIGIEGAVYRRTQPGAEGVGRTDPASAAASSRSWVRQSRHFVLVGSATGEPCRTHVRDRWILDGRMVGMGEAGEPCGLAYGRGDDIPTLEWDPAAWALVPVPGQLTRSLDWNGDGVGRLCLPTPWGSKGEHRERSEQAVPTFMIGTEDPGPDPHGRPHTGAVPMGLRGGMPRTQNPASSFVNRILEQGRMRAEAMDRASREAAARDAQRMAENQRQMRERQEAQSKRMAEQVERQRVESKAIAEGIRASAEQARQQARLEGQQAIQLAEIARMEEQAAEQRRHAEEAGRRAVEDQRKASEDARKAAEHMRQVAENERQAALAQQRVAEAERKAAEAQARAQAAAEAERQAAADEQRALEAKRRGEAAEAEARRALDEALEEMNSANPSQARSRDLSQELCSCPARAPLTGAHLWCWLWFPSPESRPQG